MAFYLTFKSKYSKLECNFMFKESVPISKIFCYDPTHFVS